LPRELQSLDSFGESPMWVYLVVPSEMSLFDFDAE
jgi:hypothetical protein